MGSLSLNSTHFLQCLRAQGFSPSSPTSPCKSALQQTPAPLLQRTKGSIHEAFDLHSHFMATGLEAADKFTLISLLKSCVRFRSIKEGQQIHSQILKLNYGFDQFVLANLIKMYAKLGEIEFARRVFDEIPEPDLVSLNSMIDGYLDSGYVVIARDLFNQIDEPDSFLWNSMIRGHADKGEAEEALFLYYQMMLTCGEERMGNMKFIFPSVLKACCQLGAIEEGEQIHGQILKAQNKSDMFVESGLIQMYARGGKLELARQLFDLMPMRDLVVWNSMICGYCKLGKMKSACELFEKMPQRDLVSWTGMIDGYAKSGNVLVARRIFDQMPRRDVISWNTMIAGYSQNGFSKEALKLFHEMQIEGLKPDGATLANTLSAISDVGALEKGKWVHNYLEKNSFPLQGMLSVSLIDMYSKCGSIEHAHKFFDSLIHKRIDHWNAMIEGLSLHGFGHTALNLFSKMVSLGVNPNSITYIAVLNACSHAGLMAEGHLVFNQMSTRKIQHYGCMVDLLSRGGHLEEACEFISNMPMKPDILVWRALLRGCRKHGNIEIGEFAAKKLLELSPHDSSCYIILSNLYAAQGRWEDLRKVRCLMIDRQVKEGPGSSWIEHDGLIHEFIVGDKFHKHTKEIYSMLDKMVERLRSVEYKLDTTQAWINLGEEEETSLQYHSEKLAIVFGLINIGQGKPIRIVKNLRICCDCHSVIKLVSKLYGREIIVRDQNRFHYFKDGSCSCMDYW